MLRNKAKPALSLFSKILCVCVCVQPMVQRGGLRFDRCRLFSLAFPPLFCRAQLCPLLNDFIPHIAEAADGWLAHKRLGAVQTMRTTSARTLAVARQIAQRSGFRAHTLAMHEQISSQATILVLR